MLFLSSITTYSRGKEITVEDKFIGSCAEGKVSHYVVVSKDSREIRTFAIRGAFASNAGNLIVRKEITSAFDVVLIYLNLGYKLQNIESISGSWRGNRYLLVEKS